MRPATTVIVIVLLASAFLIGDFYGKRRRTPTPSVDAAPAPNQHESEHELVSPDADRRPVVTEDSNVSTGDSTSDALNTAGKPAVPIPSHAPTSMRLLRPAIEYVQSTTLNPTNKTYSSSQLADLEAFIEHVNSEWLSLRMKESEAVSTYADSRIASGAFDRVTVGEAISKPSDALYFHTVHTRDGIKSVAIYAGESGEIDSILAEKAALDAQAGADLRSWFQSN